MAQFRTFWAGLIAFIIFATVGVILTLFIGGMIIDPTYDAAISLPHGCETTYVKMQSVLPWYMNLYYVIGYCSSILGALIFGQSVVKKVRMSQYEYR